MMEFKPTQEELLRREIETRKVSFLKIDKIQMRIVSILFLCAIAVYYSGNKHLMFFVATFTSAYTIFRAKVSFFSAFTFILWFSKQFFLSWLKFHHLASYDVILYI